MTTSESDREWKTEPAQMQRGWWAGGYIYRGEPGTHQGQFVPIHHFPSVDAARTFADAMMAGHSRREARAMADNA